MRKIKLKGYIVTKSRRGVKTEYLCTTQCFVDDIYEAKIYKNKEDAEKDMGIVEFNNKLYMSAINEPKYNFRIVSV